MYTIYAVLELLVNLEFLQESETKLPTELLYDVENYIFQWNRFL